MRRLRRAPDYRRLQSCFAGRSTCLKTVTGALLRRIGEARAAIAILLNLIDWSAPRLVPETVPATENEHRTSNYVLRIAFWWYFQGRR